MTPDALESVRVCAVKVQKSSNPVAFERANSDFLGALVRLAGSSRLRAVLRSTAQIVPGNFFAIVPGSIEVQRDGIAEIQRALEVGDATRAELAFAATERQHAKNVVAMMAERQTVASAIN